MNYSQDRLYSTRYFLYIIELLKTRMTIAEICQAEVSNAITIKSLLLYQFSTPGRVVLGITLRWHPPLPTDIPRCPHDIVQPPLQPPKRQATTEVAIATSTN